MSITRDNAYFDGTNLISILGLTLLGFDPAVPKRSLAMTQLARTSKGKLAGAFYTDRMVMVRASITRDTRELAEASYDALMAILQGNEKQLIIPQSGGLRLYIATYADTVYSTRGGSYQEFQLLFNCSDKFGYDVNQTQVLDIAGITAGTRTDPLSIDGSAPLQAPYIRILLNSVTSTGSKVMTVGNSANGQTVSISRSTWAAGDVIEIGPTEAGGTPKVRINGSDVAFTGAIPQFPKGAVTWIYGDTFSARNFNAQIKYFKRTV